VGGREREGEGGRVWVSVPRVGKSDSGGDMEGGDGGLEGKREARREGEGRGRRGRRGRRVWRHSSEGIR
jgi:hypothetical protein